MSEEIIQTERTCCFTGHRPEKLDRSEAEIKALLSDAIERSIADGFDTFITGMARGVDLWAAELIAEKKRTHALTLVCALPYRGIEKTSAYGAAGRFSRVLDAADIIEYILPHYTPYCFQSRNVWMVNRSSRVLAVYNGSPGGTRNTVRYARMRGLEVRNLFETQKESV